MNHEKIVPTPGLEPLLLLVGKWHTEGQRLEGPLGAASAFAAVETFEWLAGGSFLVHRLDGHYGAQPAACIELIGQDGSGMFARTFYGDGRMSVWRLSERDSTLMMNGTGPQDGPALLQVRCTMTFTELGDAMDSTWEHSSDGKNWEAFQSARSTKALPLPNTSVG